MAPTRKRAATESSASAPVPKRKGANKKGGGHKEGGGTVGKNIVTKSLQTHGFSKSKKPQYQVGLKLLLDDGIYDSKVPDEVKGHFFLYQVSQIYDDKKTIQIEYKNQVIRPKGNAFRVYRDSDDTQVCRICPCIVLFHLEI